MEGMRAKGKEVATKAVAKKKTTTTKVVKNYVI